jgi:hypothetical protein
VPSISRTEAPECRTAVDARSPIHCRLNDRESYSLQRAVVFDDREGCDQAWRVIKPVDRVVAEAEFAGRERIAETIRQVHSDRQWSGRAADAAIRRGNGQTADPRNVGGQIGDILIADGRIQRDSSIESRNDLKKRAKRIDGVTLRFDAAPRQVDCFFIDGVQARQAGALKLLKACQHERRDRQEREHNQTGSDAQERCARFEELAWSSDIRAPRPPLTDPGFFS